MINHLGWEKNLEELEASLFSFLLVVEAPLLSSSWIAMVRAATKQTVQTLT